ncbi:MAG: Ig-like domain-containing protein, partial [Muribaculaceae bacterium]|nr:Ig-like domain-containing protein [Muribaculaceae bacterium]
EVTIMAASNNGKMATAKVTVKPAGEIIEVENIRLSAQDLTLMAGTTSLLKATVEPEDATNINLAWSVADATIASVSSDGTVTAIKEGRTTVTVTCGDVSATCQVTVKEDSEITVIPGEGTNPGDDDDSPADNTENGGSLSGKDLTIRVGQTASVDLVLPEGLSEMPQFDWNLAPGGADYVSMTTSTSTLSASFTGLKEGQTSYNVLLKGNAKVLVTGKVTVIAEHPMTSLSLDPAQISMPLNSDPVQIKAVCTPENASNLTLTWSSSNPGVATVSDNGIVTPVAVGQTTITATTTDGSMLSASSEVTVFEEQHYAPIEVTLSEQNMIVRDGDEINMWAIATGGYENGWKFIWTSGENPTEILSEENHITIKAQNSNIEPLTVIYNLSILNKDDREILYEETFDYAIEIWSNPVLPGEPGYEGEEGSTGVNVSETSVREGNLLTLNADEPIGGYNFYWTYNWTFENAEIGEDEEITLVAGKESGWTGKEKSINECVYNVKLTNYGPNGELWTEALLSSPIVKVYNRPVTPAQLLRKGDGTSCTFIVIIDLLYDELTDLGYEFVYGYTDATGEDHILATTPLRYCHTTEKIYNDPSNTFWAYAIWSYEDGSAVSSGLRYLDGSEDPYFDASVFDGSYNSRSQETEGKDVTAIYTLDGHYVGNDTSRLVPGIYLINKMEGNKIVSKKFVKR